MYSVVDAKFEKPEIYKVFKWHRLESEVFLLCFGTGPLEPRTVVPTAQ